MSEPNDRPGARTAGQAITSRLLGRGRPARSRTAARVGPRPAFFHRLGVPDPFAVAAPAPLVEPASQLGAIPVSDFTWLSAADFDAEVAAAVDVPTGRGRRGGQRRGAQPRGAARSRLVARLVGERTGRRAGERVVSGPAADRTLPEIDSGGFASARPTVQSGSPERVWVDAVRGDADADAAPGRATPVIHEAELTRPGPKATARTVPKPARAKTPGAQLHAADPQAPDLRTTSARSPRSGTARPMVRAVARAAQSGAFQVDRPGPSSGAASGPQRAADGVIRALARVQGTSRVRAGRIVADLERDPTVANLGRARDLLRGLSGTDATAVRAVAPLAGRSMPGAQAAATSPGGLRPVLADATFLAALAGASQDEYDEHEAEGRSEHGRPEQGRQEHSAAPTRDRPTARIARATALGARQPERRSAWTARLHAGETEPGSRSPLAGAATAWMRARPTPARTANPYPATSPTEAGPASSPREGLRGPQAVFVESAPSQTPGDNPEAAGVRSAPVLRRSDRRPPRSAQRTTAPSVSALGSEPSVSAPSVSAPGAPTSTSRALARLAAPARGALSASPVLARLGQRDIARDIRTGDTRDTGNDGDTGNTRDRRLTGPSLDLVVPVDAARDADSARSTAAHAPMARAAARSDAARSQRGPLATSPVGWTRPTPAAADRPARVAGTTRAASRRSTPIEPAEQAGGLALGSSRSSALAASPVVRGFGAPERVFAEVDDTADGSATPGEAFVVRVDRHGRAVSSSRRRGGSSAVTPTVRAAARSATAPVARGRSLVPSPVQAFDWTSLISGLAGLADAPAPTPTSQRTTSQRTTETSGETSPRTIPSPERRFAVEAPPGTVHAANRALVPTVQSRTARRALGIEPGRDTGRTSPASASAGAPSSVLASTEPTPSGRGDRQRTDPRRRPSGPGFPLVGAGPRLDAAEPTTGRRVRSAGGLMSALSRAEHPEDVVRMVLERSDLLADASRELPGEAQVLIQRILRESGPGQREGRGKVPAQARTLTQVRTLTRRVMTAAPAGRGLRTPNESAPAPAEGGGASSVMKLAGKLKKLIHLAESERRVADAQRQVRMAEESAEARGDGGAGLSGGESAEDITMNIKALRQDVLDAVLRELENISSRREDPDGPSIWS